MPFIFQNSSYVLGYRLDENDFRMVSDHHSPRSIRSLNCVGLDELRDCLRKVRFLNALLVHPSIKDEELLQLRAILAESVPCEQIYVFGTGTAEVDLPSISSSDSSAVVEFFDGILKAQVPTRLDELMLFSIESLLPSYMPDSGLTFTATTDLVEATDFDVLTVCHVAAEPFVGQGSEYANLRALESKYPPMQGKSEVQQRDYVREMLNQFLGLLNRHLLKLDLVTSIGVPEQHDKERLATVRRTGPYLPMVTLRDDAGIFLFQLGFVHREGKERLDLSGLQLSQDEEEIDFF